MDHEGEVGEGSQHEGGDETGGDVVAWLAHKMDDDLGITFFVNVSAFTDLFGVSVSLLN